MDEMNTNGAHQEMAEEDLGSLDWTHINETILMIGLAVAQIEKTLNDGDDSIGVLTGSFISMMASINTISEQISEVSTKAEAETTISDIKSKLENSGCSEDEASDIMKSIGVLSKGMITGAVDRAKAEAKESAQLIQDTIVAFQFYDRLSQRLHQIVSSLGMMSQLFADKQRLHNPYEWAELQDSIKSRYTIDADRIMFDALLAGASIVDAVDIATSYEDETETEENEIELF